MAPRRCRVFRCGPILFMRWQPRLGLGLAERPRRWPRRWTVALDRDWFWHGAPRT